MGNKKRNRVPIARFYEVVQILYNSKQRQHKPPFYTVCFIYRLVRFRSAAVGKSERNVEFTAFLLFFCFKKLMKLDLIDSVAMEEVAGFLDKLLSKDKYEGRREANMKYVVE